jgi:transcriptional regulator with XRE-family HTH domain
MYPMLFQEKLRILREKQELTQEQVAQSLQIHRSTYAYYELGKSRPSLSTTKRLAALFGVSLQDLLDDVVDL